MLSAPPSFLVEAGGFEPPSEDGGPWASPSAARVSCLGKDPPTGRVSLPTAFLNLPDPGRKAEPRSVGWIPHALFRSPANSGEDGRLSIRRQQQQVRWHLFVFPPFLRGGGDLGSLPRGLHPRRTRSPPGFSHDYYTTPP